MRPVPRNIDKPNRSAEFLFSFLVVYYGLMFMFHHPLLAFTVAVFTVYMVNKLTIDKPEGQAYRLFYRYVRIGRMVPGANQVKRFEV
ncbi:MAG: hypothetical protein OXR68_07700 [Alphaproteobacteria bacterium]|nr:hypothetical protein [Alphaproteobacteria bacterium]